MAHPGIARPRSRGGCTTPDVARRPEAGMTEDHSAGNLRDHAGKPESACRFIHQSEIREFDITLRWNSRISTHTTRKVAPEQHLGGGLHRVHVDARSQTFNSKYASQCSNRQIVDENTFTRSSMPRESGAAGRSAICPTRRPPTRPTPVALTTGKPGPPPRTHHAAQPTADQNHQPRNLPLLTHRPGTSPFAGNRPRTVPDSRCNHRSHVVPHCRVAIGEQLPSGKKNMNESARVKHSVATHRRRRYVTGVTAARLTVTDIRGKEIHCGFTGRDHDRGDRGTRFRGRRRWPARRLPRFGGSVLPLIR